MEKQEFKVEHFRTSFFRKRIVQCQFHLKWSMLQIFWKLGQSRMHLYCPVSLTGYENRIKSRGIFTFYVPPVLYKSCHCDSPRQQSCSSVLAIWGQFWHLQGYEALVASMGLLSVSITEVGSRSVRGIGSSLRMKDKHSYFSVTVGGGFNPNIL